ncbi:MAG TPA: sulfatase-like hydrolase/transferase [Agriterribacter sp.]|nr:sulfatase-like hydrolase/transferase [Agriterribacter sp.]
MTNNTLVVFTSDNGPWLTFGNHAGNTAGLREGKGTAWEGGQRVPCIMRWPAVIPAGTICNNIASTIDLLPTIADVCKAKRPVRKIDGVNILPLMQHKDDVNPRNELVYYYDANNLKCIRAGQWKLVFAGHSQTYKKTVMGNDGWPGKYANDAVHLALYDLRTDPGETLDVKEQHPEVVEQLNAIADRYRKELGDDLTGIKGTERRAAAVVSFN